MKALKSPWKLIIFVLATLAIIQAVMISIGGYTQTQRIATASSPQSLTFRDPPYVPHLTSISGVTLRVRGHIDGTATIHAEEWIPQSFSGDVDWSVYHDHYAPEIVVRYHPTNVTGGSLKVSITFH